MPEAGSSRRVELQRNEIEDMLGRVPGWITRNGITLFLILLALLLFGSWVFKYPDTKKARIVVTSLNPPADLRARATGKIERLFISDNDNVQRGEVLAMLENPAAFDDVSQLKASLAFLDSVGLEEITEELPELNNAKLGNLQSDYSIFLKVYRDYMEFVSIDYHQRKIQTARTELEKQQEYSETLSARATTQQEVYDLATNQFNRDFSLIEEGVISDSDLEESRQAMLAESNKHQEILSFLAENNISIARTENQIVELELKQQEENSGMITALEEAYNNLNASITSWEQNYLLVAPVSGSVTFTNFWSENQNVKAGEKVMTIIPADEGSTIGKISLPLEGAGKVKIGDQVNVQFDNYPHMEFGMVRGYVSDISEVPDEGFYTVEVEFPKALRTYYDFNIPFSQNLQGSAEIYTDKKRMIQRVLDPIRSAISKQAAM